ncbi:ATP-binding cassette domain-containing protein [Aliiglaciecola lipolytica]|uniref:Molybdate transport system ATP-binding protein n=1 Tax=Aliiglaciecola lipolytica E3 TaxID=1127673 RepID=K6YVZ9_9ALTE|nr:ATP-binding cassette domain-containing protein [Aliiglaciecola lipolytica]GAC15425.1 molybdate transport system ATP-binding protein [Aliiglaciecola lipolytica E3]
MIDIENYCHPKLKIERWHVKTASAVAVLGKNGAGKQFVDQLLLGKLTNPQYSTLRLPNCEQVVLVSFETLQAVFENELKIDETDITDEIDFGTPAKEFLPADKLQSPLIDIFHLSHRLETGFRQLSTGESRKLLILKAILSGASCLILDNPFDDLDTSSRAQLSTVLKQLSEQNITLIMLLSNRQDIPDWINTFALVDHNTLHDLSGLSEEQARSTIDTLFAFDALDKTRLEKMIANRSGQHTTQIVNINNASVSYAEIQALATTSLHIQTFQHTLITGPNGSGKSTLLQLVTGDCPQCFSNDVTIMGFKRGSGETIWDIKKHLGIVSPDIHRSYRVSCNALTVVLSGFMDSIGLYKDISQAQKQQALDWLDLIGLRSLANSNFKQLSFGEQRLLLIARALVKFPSLLVLDEPTQGLDEINRRLVLDVITSIAKKQLTTILMVSHREDERLPIFTQHIQLSAD